MSYNAPRDPCRIDDSDSEDEKGDRLRIPITFTTRPATPKVITRVVAQPKIADWDVPSNTLKPDGVPSGRISSSSSSGSSSGPNKTPNPLVTTVIPESPPASPAVLNPSNFDPFVLIQEDLSKFVNIHIPKDYPLFIQCRLKRDKVGVQGGFFPTFYLQAERPSDNQKIFLLAARKVVKVNRQSEYLLSTNIETLSEKSGGDGYIGKLRGQNLAGTEYILYDNGTSPNKRHSKNRDALRRELSAIVYNTNILGFRGPRQMSVMIPELGHDIRPMKDDSGILDQWKSRRLNYLIQLRNRSPKYNEETKTYVLQFTGNRVAQPSVKNFQIVIENEHHEEEVVMQFGRVDEDTFTCDYRHPLSAIQAFGIALSSFDSRIVRE